MDPAHAAFDELYVYTMGRRGFILQHVVDAFAVQTANDQSKPIFALFGLVGLYLHVERQFSGHEVQKAHMRLARRRRKWPRVRLPENRGAMSVVDVLAAPAGVERDEAIEEWCRLVWAAVAENRETVASLLREYQIA